MSILGIDPGQSGGLASVVYDPITSTIDCVAIAMPDTERDVWNVIASMGDITKAYIEDVHSMPKQGVSSSFKFGYNLGILRMALIAAEIPFEKVSPQRWQKYMGCLTHGDKNISKAKAQELFPQVKVTHAIADALLIAEYGRRVSSFSSSSSQDVSVGHTQ